jgi:hypothetical protein
MTFSRSARSGRRSASTRPAVTIAKSRSASPATSATSTTRNRTTAARTSTTCMRGITRRRVDGSYPSIRCWMLRRRLEARRFGTGMHTRSIIWSVHRSRWSVGATYRIEGRPAEAACIDSTESRGKGSEPCNARKERHATNRPQREGGNGRLLHAERCRSE